MSNLPPGVSDSMIPGNRPEDAAFDDYEDRFLTFLESFGLDYDKFCDYGTSTDKYERLADDVWTFICANVPEVGTPEPDTSVCPYCGHDIHQSPDGTITAHRDVCPYRNAAF